jgi:type III restriction enzyme
MLVESRRPSIRFLASAKEPRRGLTGIVGKQSSLIHDMGVTEEHRNEFVNNLRDEVRRWREDSPSYKGTSNVTRRLLEWWFERDEERKAQRKRFFFCQQEAIESVIYLYEANNKQKMPETGDLLRYALKMATGTGKTLVMALLITWATLHKAKVSDSTLSSNFLVIVPNITVRDRVSGFPRGDGLDRTGAANLYEMFDTVPPEYLDSFNPNVTVKNWQAMVNEPQRDDWIPDEFQEEGRFVPASVFLALQRRRRNTRQDDVRHIIGSSRDLVIINDEAHHVYGEKRVSKGEDPEYIKWNLTLQRISKAAKVPLVVDMSATPWYGSGSPRPEGTLFEWLISDFSVYDAFESGLIKVVRLPEEGDRGRIYLDLWEMVKGAKSKEDYLSASKGAIEHIYSSWKEDFEAWDSQPKSLSGPPPVLLIVANDATRAKWLFDHVTRDYELLRNPPDSSPTEWITIQVDSKVFDAEQGNEATLRKMVNTVGSAGQPGEKVRCIISVNMLTEGWDVKTVTHILGLRAFVSPLLTEQIIGRGLRRTNYDVLNQPLDERPEGYEETMDAFGIPFIGFPVEKRTRPRTGEWGHKPVWVEIQEKKSQYRIGVPNVRAWAAGMVRPLSEAVNVSSLPKVAINPSDTPPEVRVRPVVGTGEQVMTYERFRAEFPLLRSAFEIANELYDRINPVEEGSELAAGPVFDEIIEVVLRYFQANLTAIPPMDLRDVGIRYWSKRVRDVLETGIRGSTQNGVRGIPVLGDPERMDTSSIRRFQWTGITYEGKKTHSNLVACHTDLERDFAVFLDEAKDVVRYVKNERFGFSVTYYEAGRPRQYYPDFIVLQKEEQDRYIHWLAETKGEIRPNTMVKSEAAELWCKKLSGHTYGEWRQVLVQQRDFEQALNTGVKTFADLGKRLRALAAARVLTK